MISSRSEKTIAAPPALDARLAMPAFVAASAAFVLTALPLLATTCALVLGASAVGALVAALVLRRRARRSLLRSRLSALAGALAVGLALGALVGASVATAEPVRHPEGLVDRVLPLELVVTSLPEPNTGGGDQLDALLVVAGDRDGLRVPVRVTRTAEAASFDGVSPGQRWAATGRLTAERPGDRSAFRVAVSGPATRLSDAPWYLSWAERLRDSLRDSARGLPDPGAQLIPGLAVGDVGAVGDELRTRMIASGLTHLTAVSGANCAIVIAAIGMLVAAIGLRRGLRVVVALAGLVAFVVLVTASPSVMRASLMCAIALLARAAGRPAAGLPALCLSVIVLVIADPWLAREPGFALSVAATAGLLFSGPRIALAFARVMPSWLAAALSIPIAAQLWCQPILVLLQPTVSPASVVANLLAEPAAPLATIAGLIACLVGAAVPPTAHVMAAFAWPPAAWIAAVAGFFGRDELVLPWAGGVLGVVLALAASVLVLLAILSGRRRVRAASGAMVLAFAIAWTGWHGGGLLVAAQGRPTDWDIAACDIGQGDAVLVRSAGRIALVDTGPDPSSLASCLDRLGVVSIDLLVLTHYDLDHAGGIPAVVSRVATALTGPPGRPSDHAWLRQLDEVGVQVLRAFAPQTGSLGDLSWRILWPRHGDTRSGNAAGITIELCGRYCALFLADLDAEAQRSIAGSVRDVDVVKVAHHGSADQFPPLYAKAAADVGIVSVGAGNSYGHPTRAVLDILAASGTRVLRTDERGMIVLALRDDGAWEVWSERASPAIAMLSAYRSVMRGVQHAEMARARADDRVRGVRVPRAEGRPP